MKATWESSLLRKWVETWKSSDDWEDGPACYEYQFRTEWNWKTTKTVSSGQPKISELELLRQKIFNVMFKRWEAFKDGYTATVRQKRDFVYFAFSFLLSNNFFALERSSCIILLCGIPASGKTQYASVLLKCINRLEEASEPFFTAFGKVPSFSACILEFDDYLRQSLSKNQGSFSPELWHESRRLAHQNLEDKLMHASSSSTALQKDFHVIIVEDTMQYRTMRMKIFQLATKCVYLFFPAKPCVHHF